MPPRPHHRLFPATLLSLASVVGIPTIQHSVAQAAPCPGVECLYVSPSGNDANPGSPALPIRTLSHAQALVRLYNRNMTGNIIVYLEPGVFRLKVPLTFGRQDSGTNGYLVEWEAVPGASPTISGAIQITGWRTSDPRHHIWSAPVPPSLNTRQIYVNGMRANLAFGPPPVTLTKTSYGYKASSDLMASWLNPRQIDFDYLGQLGQMSEPICPVAGIKGREITMAQPCWANSTTRDEYAPATDGIDDTLVSRIPLTVPTYIENAYELLNQPGEFYLDQPTRTLYYIPRTGQNMATADVEAPALQSLVTGNGTAASSIQDITFSGINFAYATWLQPGKPTGFSEVQAGYTITGTGGVSREGLCQLAPDGACPYGAWTKEPANVSFTFDRDIAFLNDRFFHLGAAGLNLGDGSQDDTVRGCAFTDISGNGLELGGVDMPEAGSSAQTTAINVTDNHLFGLPVEFHGGVAILAGYISDSSISHNQIDHVSYTGISMGWGGWPAKIGDPSEPNNSHDNVVADNLIFDFLQTMADGAGIYTMGITGDSLADGELVTGNIVHDRVGWGAGIKSDDGTGFVTYSNNVMYDDLYDWNNNSNIGVTQVYLPQVVEGNYWQQGGPDQTQFGVSETDNAIITGASQVPAVLLSAAGIEPAYRAVLAWRPWGRLVPDPPQEVMVEYAFQGRAYVTWHPSTDNNATSYSVDACPESDGLAVTCRTTPVSQATVSTSTFNQVGYAIVSGLESGQTYHFTVVANNAEGSSTASVPSPAVTVLMTPPAVLGTPNDGWARVTDDTVVLQWYPPTPLKGALPAPALSYSVEGPGVVGFPPGRLLLVSSSGGAKEMAVVTGLSAGQTYSFSIAAVNPGGSGPAATINATTLAAPP